MHWTPRDIVVVAPTLGRPWTLAPLLASLDATAPGCHIIFGVTPGDEAAVAELERLGQETFDVEYQPVGDYARKINTGYRLSDEPLIFTAATDLRFHPGWWQAATARLAPGIGVVGTNDLGNTAVLAGVHSTHSLVTRDYADTYGTVDGPGAVMAECYPHEWVDTEFVETAMHRGAWAMAQDSIVEHLHPNWGKAATDSGYLAEAARTAAGRPIFDARRPRWT